MESWWKEVSYDRVRGLSQNEGFTSAPLAFGSHTLPAAPTQHSLLHLIFVSFAHRP